MSIDAINPIGEFKKIELPSSSEVRNNNLYQVVSSELQHVSEQYRVAEEQALTLTVGNLDDVHQVMSAINKAKLSFELVTQVRNKLLEGYQEIMKMQV
ncbi:flagellar hook-basal body complex protein FliE [Microbulbifer sp. GL-2]|uniref:flagellar hook-basal body complex protein FliE n=1 Tax=Microbulbifer sp. GL-2 TaxID=2591606 RepID=UPI0011638884|nr:flagellar hook-basal body complex protein FliE [Microbulbifer sp. GL-2]BBM00350.1 flagellar hook-basal body complex protein FliE [Microbulbifer sp. GL-2]